MKTYVPVLTFVMLVAAVLLCFGHGDEEVAEDEKMVNATGKWIYNDLEKGIEEAKKTDQPILVVFR